VHDAGSVGDMPPGERRSAENEFMLVTLLAVSDMFDAYELLRPADDTDEMEPWGMTLSLGVGEPLETTSRRRRRSPADGMLCRAGSSPSGDDALLFCPAVWYSVGRAMALSI
jgi:hypothetical protein